MACMPIGFLIGLPFALVALVLSVIGGVIYCIGSVVSCICPCCICCAVIANFAMWLLKLPFGIINWFTEKIPC